MLVANGSTGFSRACRWSRVGSSSDWFAALMIDSWQLLTNLAPSNRFGTMSMRSAQFSFFSSESSSFFFPNILPFNFANIALTFPIRPGFFLGSTASNLREERLWNEPNAMATTVQAKQITLYGILKSGVGRVIRRISVWRRRNTSSSGVVLRLDKRKPIKMKLKRQSQQYWQSFRNWKSNVGYLGNSRDDWRDGPV